MSEVYEGRMVADGYGNLLADEGDHKGDPVAYDNGKYVFVEAGEPSHNARHEKNVLEMHATQDVDPDLDGYAGTQNNPVEGAEHHWEVGEPNNYEADNASAKGSGHTAAYTKGDN
jgi:hypothetical protein